MKMAESESGKKCGSRYCVFPVCSVKNTDDYGEKLFQVPTSMSVNAAFGHRFASRIDGNINYIGWTVPEAVYVDYDIIKKAPKKFLGCYKI